MANLTEAQQAAVDQIIASKSTQYNVDESLIRAVIQQESNWDINARLWEPKLNTPSIGLMQVLVTTASSVAGTLIAEDQLYDPNINIDIGVKYLGMLQNQFGSQGLQAVIASYNAGSPRFTSEGSFINQDYVDKVMMYYEMFESMGNTVGQIAAETVQRMTGGPRVGSEDSPLGMFLLTGAILLLDVYKVFGRGKK